MGRILVAWVRLAERTRDLRDGDRYGGWAWETTLFWGVAIC